MNNQNVGDLLDENYLVKDRPVTGTAAVTVISPSIDWPDGISFQIKTADYVQPLLVTATDSVTTAADATWVFANGQFTAAMVGGTFVVKGATNAGNNGTKTITAVTNATTVVTAAGTTVTETFTAAVNVIVTVSADPIQAAFTVEVSDNYSRAQAPHAGQVPYAGDWAPVTTKFANTGSPFFPAIAAITADGSAYYQMVPFMGRYVRWVITPSAGTGNLSFLYTAKGSK